MKEIKKIRFLIKEGENINEYRIEALLVIEQKTDMQQNEIVSNIRAIPGITTVKIIDTIKRSHYYMSKLNVKIDTNPYGSGLPLDSILQRIRQEVLRIDGVRRWTYLSAPIKL